MASCNQRLDRFYRFFGNHNGFTLIANRESDIPNPRNPEKSYKRYERVFKVELSEIANAIEPTNLTHSNHFSEDDDMPFY